MSGLAPAANGLASIIVPCFDQLDYTRLCVAALARHTRPPWELIAVDNGSTDGTAAYLTGVRDVAPFPVTVVANAENRGFPAACNQGLAAARGDYLVLLNNDAVVTDGWLDQLVALADADPAIGMVGPMSNYASPPQQVPDAPYADLDGMHRFAAWWRQQHRGAWLKAAKLSGFCLLIRRVVLEAIGGLDERFGPGLLDDDDLALRARRAGFELAVALDLFVHHFGSRTFVGAGLDAGALLAANRTRFEAKWGAEAPALREATLAPRALGSTAPEIRRGDPAGPSGRPARAKVFGIGLPRTGTTSVAAAMLELGFRTCHACFDDALFDRGDAFFDTPVYADYPNLDRRYPGSKFILTWREPAAWYASFARTLGGHLRRLRTQDGLPPGQRVDRRCYAQVFGEDELAEGPFVARYREHCRRVEAYFRDRPGDLLVLDLEAAVDPWGELCWFLGLPRPSTPFPRLNAKNLDQWMGLRHANKLPSL